MSNIEQTIARITSDLEAAEQREQESRAAILSVTDSYERRGEKQVTRSDRVRIDAMFADIEQSRASQGRLRAKLEYAQKVQAEERELDASASDIHPVEPRKISDHDSEIRADGAAEHAGTLKNGDRVASLYGAPVQRDDSREWRYADSGRIAALRSDQKFADHEAVKAERARYSERDKHIIGMHGSLGHMVRAMSTSGASAIVPVDYSNTLIEKARNKAVALQAGATLVLMSEKTVHIGRLTGDPTSAFGAEAGLVTASDATYDYIELVARRLSALTVFSLEFAQDAIDAPRVIEDAIASSMALELDKNILFGQIVTGAAEGFNLPDPSPKGVLKSLLDNAATNVLGDAQTNGTTQATGTYFRELQQLAYQPAAYNERTTAFVTSVKGEEWYRDSYDTTGQPLRWPENLARIPILTTNTIPTFTRGTLTQATDWFAGDWSTVLVGVRMGTEIQVLRERYMENGQFAVVAFGRYDVQLARPRAMAAFRYLKGSA